MSTMRDLFESWRHERKLSYSQLEWMISGLGTYEIEISPEFPDATVCQKHGYSGDFLCPDCSAYTSLSTYDPATHSTGFRKLHKFSCIKDSFSIEFRYWK